MWWAYLCVVTRIYVRGERIVGVRGVMGWEEEYVCVVTRVVEFA